MLLQDGSYLAELLLSKGYKVHGIIRRSSSFNTGRIEHLYSDPVTHTGGGTQFGFHLECSGLFDCLPASFQLHYGDMTDSSCLMKLISLIKPSEIYHLAAQSHVKVRRICRKRSFWSQLSPHLQVSFDLPEYTAEVDGTLRLLDSIVACGLTDKVRFYQASTSELYGKVQEVPQKETTPFYPRSPYGGSDRVLVEWQFVQAALQPWPNSTGSGSSSTTAKPTTCSLAMAFCSITKVREEVSWRKGREETNAFPSIFRFHLRHPQDHSGRGQD